MDLYGEIAAKVAFFGVEMTRPNDRTQQQRKGKHMAERVPQRDVKGYDGF